MFTEKDVLNKLNKEVCEAGGATRWCRKHVTDESALNSLRVSVVTCINQGGGVPPNVYTKLKFEKRKDIFVEVEE